jgi:hypothetical protein
MNSGASGTGLCAAPFIGTAFPSEFGFLPLIAEPSSSGVVFFSNLNRTKKEVPPPVNATQP